MLDDLLVDAEGNRTVITPANGEYYAKEELQSYVGGGVLIFHLDNGDYLFGNPDGETLALPFNGEGTHILIDHGFKEYNARGTIVLADASHVDLSKLITNVEVAG